MPGAMMSRNRMVIIDWLDPPVSAVGFHANGIVSLKR